MLEIKRRNLMNSNISWKYPKAIVNCEWLAKNLNQLDIRIYDCTTYLHYSDNDPNQPYNVESGEKDYENSHILNSAFLDLQADISEQNSPYRFTLPKLNNLATKFENLGIGDPYHIILYSRNGMQWSARVWWMLRAIGFDNVSVLDGGFIEWKRLDLEIDNKVQKFLPANLTFQPRSNIFVDKEKVLKAINDDNIILLNSLTEDIHIGKNPRYGRRGRIPNSLNVPFNQLLDDETGKFKPLNELSDIFSRKKITSDRTVLNYCGGGIAASLDAFVLYQLGFNNIQIYDNSMSEWAIDQNLPIEIG